MMASSYSSITHIRRILLPLFGMLILSFSIEAEKDNPLLNTACKTPSNPSSTYEANVKTLISSLSSNGTRDSGFYSAVMGNGTINSANGQFLCRGDLTPTTCQQCVTLATNKTLELCPKGSKSAVFYNQCMLRYTSGSNTSFKFDESPFPNSVYWNDNKTAIADPTHFSQSVWRLWRNVTAKAANSSLPGKKYAIHEEKLTATQNLYGLAQCMPDLTPSDCTQCFQTALQQYGTAVCDGQTQQKAEFCAQGSPSIRVLLAGCNIRYELYAFYNGSDGTEPSPAISPSGKDSKVVVIPVVTSIVVLVAILCIGCFILRIKARKRTRKAILRENLGVEITTLDSLQVEMATIQAATNNFSNESRIGKGGFGEVYKGILSNGQEIAVKRLSRTSVQGVKEFKNEVLLIAKLQHRNLVRLLGFGINEEEKILIYEYVPNKSLSHFLFDPQKERELTWPERFKIIQEIVRGILYLHEDSRLKIIHRDLKPSNVLLDSHMSPKISDFGMAKIVTLDQIKGCTSRIVGTYGYMAPEYAMHGYFSVKSDVFSFGVMVLEIISGRRNSCSFESYRVDDLLSYAWRQWKDGSLYELIDPAVRESFSEEEVFRCIQIGLLCVQENPDDRPTMGTVASYLSNASVELPYPQEPAFFMLGKRRNNVESTSRYFTNTSIPSSINEMSISKFLPR